MANVCRSFWHVEWLRICKWTNDKISGKFCFSVSPHPLNVTIWPSFKSWLKGKETGWIWVANLTEWLNFISAMSFSAVSWLNFEWRKILVMFRIWRSPVVFDKSWVPNRTSTYSALLLPTTSGETQCAAEIPNFLFSTEKNH